MGSSGGINILPAGNHGQGAKNSCGNASIWKTISNTNAGTSAAARRVTILVLYILLITT